MEYIDIGTIKKTIGNSNTNIDVYQVQPIPKNKIIINNIGKITKKTNILINKYNHGDNECQIVSILFTLEELLVVKNKFMYPLIKIVTSNKGNIINNIYYAFLPNSSNNTNIIKTEIIGKFAIFLEKDGKFALISLIQEYTDYDDMIELLVKASLQYC